MKRLFGIKKPNGDWYEIVTKGKNTNTGSSSRVIFFTEKKKGAKALRDVLNAKLPRRACGAYTVTVGPDHDKFNN